MKKLLLIITALTTVGCSSIPEDTKTHLKAQHNFTYVSDKANEWKLYETVNKPFSGDCEDYAFSLQKAMGGTVYHVTLTNGQHHAVLVKSGLVYDNMRKWPVQVAEYKAKFNAPLHFDGKGEVIDNRS